MVTGLVMMALSRKAKQPDGTKQITDWLDQAKQAGLTQISATEYIQQSDPARMLTC